jgi:hypothetical protein
MQTTDEFQLAACCHLLSEVRQLADDNLHQFSCVAVPRSCNRVAHSLEMSKVGLCPFIYIYIYIKTASVCIYIHGSLISSS